MEENILLIREKDELIAEKKEEIEALKELISDPTSDATEEELEEWKRYIERIENEIDFIDDDRVFLVNKFDNSKIVVDFWQEYESNDIHEINKNGFHLIEIPRDHPEEGESCTLLDFNGYIEVEYYLEYGFVGQEIKVLQTGSMLDLPYNRDVEFWSIVGSDVISFAQSIEYIEEHFIYLVNETRCYNNYLEYIGEKIESKYLSDEYLIFIAENKKLGVLLKGEILIEPEYSLITPDTDFDEFDIFITKKKGLVGIYVYFDNKLFYQKEFEGKKLELFDVIDNRTFLILIKSEEILNVIIYNKYSNEENQFAVDEFFQVDAPFISDVTIFCGINYIENNTMLFLSRFRSSEIFPFGINYFTFAGKDFKKIIPEFLNSLYTFRSIK